MSRLLPVGTTVTYTPNPIDGCDPRPPQVAKVVGYDMFYTKYQLGVRFAGLFEWHFADGGTWAFPSEVEAIDEEATR